MQFIHLKCRVQWFLVCLQLCATITIMVNFTFFYHGQVLLKPSDYLVGLKGLGWRDHKTPSGSFRSLVVRVDGVVIMYQEKCKHKRQKEIEIFFFLQNIQSSLLETLYRNRSNLETIFRIIDSDHSGKGTHCPVTFDTQQVFYPHPCIFWSKISGSAKNRNQNSI